MNNRGRNAPRDTRSSEHRAAEAHMSSQHPRGRRNSLSQTTVIHNAATLAATAPVPSFSATDLEAMRRSNGAISVNNLISQMHPSQEQPWRPQLGGGRNQIRTGRNFQVPDQDNPGQHFTVRVHTNDLTVQDNTSHAHSQAVVRIQRSTDNRYLMGGSGHTNDAGNAAWAPVRASDQQINAAHIPTRGGRRQ